MDILPALLLTAFVLLVLGSVFASGQYWHDNKAVVNEATGRVFFFLVRLISAPFVSVIFLAYGLVILTCGSLTLFFRIVSGRITHSISVKVNFD